MKKLSLILVALFGNLNLVIAQTNFSWEMTPTINGNDGAIEINNPNNLSFNISNGSSALCTNGLAQGWYTISHTTASGNVVTQAGEIIAFEELMDVEYILNDKCSSPINLTANLKISWNANSIPYYPEDIKIVTIKKLAANNTWITVHYQASYGSGPFLSNPYTVAGLAVQETYKVEIFVGSSWCAQPRGRFYTKIITPTCNSIQQECNVLSAEVTSSNQPQQNLTPPFSYVWNNGSTTQTIPITQAGMQAYSVTVTDAYGLTVSMDGLFQAPQQPIKCAIKAEQPYECQEETAGYVQLSITGGTAPFNVEYIGSSTQLTGVSTTGAHTFNNITENGGYTINVTDANGCSCNIMSGLTYKTPTMGIVMSPNEDCPTATDVTVNIIPPTNPWGYGYDIKYQLIPQPTGQTVIWSTTNLPANTTSHTETVFANHGDDLQVYLYAHTASGLTQNCLIAYDKPFINNLNANWHVQDFHEYHNLCQGTPVYLNPDINNYSNTPLYYQWNTGEYSEDIVVNASGYYNVIISDDCGITNTVHFIVQDVVLNVSDELTYTANGLCNVANVTANIYGYETYTINWSNGQTETFSGSEYHSNTSTVELANGNHSYTVTDNCGNTVVEQFTIQNPAQTITVNTSPVSICSAQNMMGTASLVTSGLPSPLTISWLNNYNQHLGNGPTLDNLAAGNYTVEIIDGNGCVHFESFTIVAEPQMTAGFHSILGCSLSVSVNGGLAPYTLNLLEVVAVTPVVSYNTVGNASLNAPGSADFTDLPNGTYHVSVIDAAGCEIIHTEAIINESPPTTHLYYRFVDPSERPEIETQEEEVEEAVEQMISAMNNAIDLCKQQEEVNNLEAMDLSCGIDQLQDELSIEYAMEHYHYTLYYYDRAGNLIKTVPPAGVNFLDGAEIADIKSWRNTATAANIPAVTEPSHNMETKYYYNSLGLLEKQETPDGGISNFLYDEVGRLRFSQNAQQEIDGSFSYTHYDGLSRIIEVGQANLADYALLQFADLGAHTSNLTYPSVDREQVTRTNYSRVVTGINYNGEPQTHLHHRVSQTTLDEDGDFTTLHDQVNTYYSYDPHGNVKWLVQDLPFFGKNYIAYEYDLISGNVLQVSLNKDRADEFHHRYSYDANNRLVKVETSRDQLIWEEDADYEYFKHGPLKTQNIGHDNIQGIDYTYTLQGWLKGINTPSLNPADDPGEDGLLASLNGNAPDLFGMGLEYFDGDYKKTGSIFDEASSINTPNDHDLYNGNIAEWQTNTAWATGNQLSKRNFRYDELNRITKADFQTFSTSGWNATTDDYKSTYQYDPNGNLSRLFRNAYGTNQAMDIIEYHYKTGNNQLLRIDDIHQNSSYADDIETSHMFSYGSFNETDPATHSYAYDAIGNLIADPLEEIDAIEWTVYGKVKAINRTASSTKDNLAFMYDASGNRITKIVKPHDAAGPEDWKYTFYVRDASGNIMGTYTMEMHPRADLSPTSFEATYKLETQPIYGSSRIGQIDEQDFILSEQLFDIADLDELELNISPYQFKEAYHNWLSTQANYPSLKVKIGSKFSPITDIYSLNGDNTGTFAVNEFEPDQKGMLLNDVFVAENFDGKLVFNGYTMLSHEQSVTYLFNRNGTLSNIFHDFDPQQKSIALQSHNSQDKYWLFMLDLDGMPWVSTFDAGLVGYPNQLGMKNSGAFSVPQAFMHNSKYRYGRHMAAMEDQETGKRVLYQTRYNSASKQNELIAWDLSAGLASASESLLITYPNVNEHGVGELQLQNQGKTLVLYGYHSSAGNNYGGLINTEDSKVMWFSLSEDGLALINKGEFAFSTAKLDDHSALFSKGMKKIYFTKKPVQLINPGGFSQNLPVNIGGATSGTSILDPNGNLNNPVLGGTEGIYTYSLSTGAINQVHDQTGELRMGLDGNVYMLHAGVDLVRFEEINGQTSVSGPLNIGDATKDYAHPILPSQVIKKDIPNRNYKQEVREIGKKQYELSDHLGNVRATFSDKKILSLSGTPGNISLSYSADLLSAQDYYPGGMLMPGRQYNSNSYAFGYQGSLKDDEVSGQGNSYTTFYRQLDPRLARWKSLDPVIHAYQSQYTSMDNNPIALNDPRGDDVASKLQGHPDLGGGGGGGHMSLQIRLFSIWQTASRYSVPAGYIGGMAASAIDPNPTADYTIGVPGDEIIGNILGQAVRSFFNSNGVQVAKQWGNAGIQFVANNAKMWGGNIITLNKAKTTTVLGRMSETGHVIATGQFRANGENVGGLNLLSRNDEWASIVSKHTKDKDVDWAGATKEFWDKYNKLWLDEAIERGDDIRLVSDPSNIKNLEFANGDPTMFGREVKHLKESGYVFKDGYAVKEP